MNPTPTVHSLPLRQADFSNLTDALDYAAKGDTGFNFFSGSGKLLSVLPYRSLREEARLLALRLLGMGFRRAERVAIVAETGPEFMEVFFACQYAGLVPVPVPAAIHIGGHKVYVENLRRLLTTCDATGAVAPEAYLPLLEEAAGHFRLRFLGAAQDIGTQPNGPVQLDPSSGDDLAYLQYTSGSTRFPRGVMVTQAGVMDNLAMIVGHGMRVNPEDRAVSWLPYYHDMGLVGFVLAPMAAQRSVDYLSPRSFAMRPRLWLALMSRNRGTLSFSPPFGYELCARSLKPPDIAALDLTPWRVAGLGAEPIRPEPLARFADLLAPAGFDSRSFLAGYGMAECTLAVSFSSLGKGLVIDHVDRDLLAETHQACTCKGHTIREAAARKTLVDCGEPLPGYEVEIRNDDGLAVPERTVGALYVRGPSVMKGYFGDTDATAESLSPDGWLKTGDLAYRIGRRLIITGREKDMMIINGRNIWPQDLEVLAEGQPEVRTGDASAFAVEGCDGSDKAVLVIQCKPADGSARKDLADRIRSLVLSEQGIPCTVEIVPRHTLPRTTSGKLSRSRARKDYLQRQVCKATMKDEKQGQGIRHLRQAANG
ncbi:MAG: fatty acyl-AMP ligase [Desulfobacterales bacterium]|jgi:fatty-acyl-CoA synthase